MRDGWRLARTFWQAAASLAADQWFTRREGQRMTVLRLIGLMAVLIAFEASATPNACDTACKKAQIDLYFERLSAVYRRGSTSSDIDRLFELFAPDVRYAHKEYDVNFECKEWRSAFNSNLQRGAYDKDRNELIEVTKVIHGQRYSAVEYTYMRREPDGTLRAADAQGGLFALIGFKGDRIVLIEEYW
jgi:hypothetical protein